MMAYIFILPVDVILYIFRFVDLEDKISFALTCERFRRLCVDEGVFRILDLSRRAISTTQRGAVSNFFRDRLLTQHIRELNFSNLRVLNWQIDRHLEEFISICPHLEALHVLDCGVSFRRLCRILKQAPQLTALSWSLWDFTSKDKKFLSESMKLSEGICFKNIKRLHLETLISVPHIEIAKCLVLSCCRDLEELEIYTWGMDEAHRTRGSFPQPSVENELQHLHSLVVASVGRPVFKNDDEAYRSNLSNFIISILSRKSKSTKWKKFWVSPLIGLSREHFSLLHKDDFQSLEAIGIDPCESPDAVEELKNVFARIGDNSVRSFYLCLPTDSDSIVEFCELISRVGGDSLRVLRLSFYLDKIRAEQIAFIHSLFSDCWKITELDLLDCSFEKDICKSLSKLKHLTKVQLEQCAISSKHIDENGHEVSFSSLILKFCNPNVHVKTDLQTFVENCKNITHLHVHGGCQHEHFSCILTDDDLLALAKLRNLKHLTLYDIHGIREWTFLKDISEHCKFLTTLRISVWEHFDDCDIQILMESSRFLKHLAIEVDVPILELEVFWNLLSHAKNLERLCITSWEDESINIPVVAVETLKSLPRLHVLHLHVENIENVGDLYDQMISILEEKESDCRFSFEFDTGHRRNTWISHQTGYRSISDKLLPLNSFELCSIRPILDIPIF